MAKTAGMGDNFYVSGYDIGGDVNSVSKISGGPAALDMTGISSTGYERQGGERDGGMDFTCFHDPGALASHVALSPLPAADVIVTYGRGSVIGNPCASLVGKQVNYDPTRGTDGSLTFAVSAQANAFGLEWGVMLTPDRRVDASATAAGAGNRWDTVGSLAFGAQMYVHLFALTSGSVTIKVQDSADGTNFIDIAGTSLTTAALNTANQAVRISIPNTTTVRQYVAVATTGVFTGADFFVHFTKNATAGQVY